MGLGIEPPGTSLGVMVSLGRDYMLTHWWLAVLPSIIIVVLILDISLIGDWLRDRLDPKLKMLPEKKKGNGNEDVKKKILRTQRI